MGYSDCRNLDDIKLSLTRQRDDYEFEMSLWKNVKLLKKKDGTDFASRSKSFENAEWDISGIARDKYHPVLRVSGWDKRGCSRHFELYMYVFTDELPSTDERKSKGQRLDPNCKFIRETYTFSPDEAYSAVQSRILFLERAIQRLDDQISVSDEVYTNFFSKIDEAYKQLKTDCNRYSLRQEGGTHPCSLEYAMIDVLKEQTYLALK